MLIAMKSQKSSDKQANWRQALRRARNISDKLGMPIDKEVVATVAVMNLLGFNTTGSCGGHVRRATGGPYVIFQNPEAEKLAQRARDIGDYKDLLYKKIASRLIGCEPQNYKKCLVI